jgi:hypothetical protein
LGKKKINKIRTALMGVVPEYQGRGSMCCCTVNRFRTDLIKDFYSSEVGWILESNVQMIRVAEKIGGELDKTYRMYKKEL